MDHIFTIFLIIHVIAGAIGLLSGTWNMISKKGTLQHKQIGKVFYLSMLATGGSSIILAILHPSQFMFMIGIFTIYMVATGQRYLRLKKQQPNFIDWGLSMGMLIASIWLVYAGLNHILHENFFGAVFLTFGGFGLNYIRQDNKNYHGKSAIKNFWLSEHIQRMVGGFIAASTAFLVVNSKYFPDSIPGIIYWLLPSVIFTPFIIKWAIKYEVKKN